MPLRSRRKNAIIIPVRAENGRTPSITSAHFLYCILRTSRMPPHTHSRTRTHTQHSVLQFTRGMHNSQ